MHVLVCICSNVRQFTAMHSTALIQAHCALIGRVFAARFEGGVGLGWVGSRPRQVAYPRSAPPSLRDPTGRPYPGVRSQGLPDC